MSGPAATRRKVAFPVGYINVIWFGSSAHYSHT
jgi:hypothetical protein